jgi:peptide/nickel transport system permease protein
MLWGIATLAFCLVNLIPGSPARTILGDGATAGQVAELDRKMGYDRPLAVQYGSWLSHVVRGDFGTSLLTGRPTTADVGARLPITLSVVAGAVLLTVLAGITVGVLGAIGGRRVDRAGQSVLSFFMAVPSFWLGVLLVFLFSIKFGWLPATGYVPFGNSPGRWLASIALPCLSVAAVGIATIGRQTRGAMLDVLTKDYIRTLRASGISRRSLILKHALRNASIPIVTSVGFQFIGLLGSTVIVEQVFGLNGLGSLTLSAVNGKDFPVVLTVVLFTTGIVLAANLLIDVANAWLNPKARRS